MKSFLYNYIRSMRLYYCFVTGTTVLAGLVAGRVAIGSHSEPTMPCRGKDAVLLAVGFLAWGVNHIFSDFLDRKEDAVNAPHRPMVTGALRPCPALLLSAAMMLFMAVASFLVSSWTLPVLAAGAVLNGAYSWLKRVPVLNCLVYAMSITCCALYGFTGTTESFPCASTIGQISLQMFPIHFLMCHNSYYKDIEGDRAAGVRTLQTCFDKRVSLLVAIIVYMLSVGISTYMSFLAPDGGGRFSASHVFLPAAGYRIENSNYLAGIFGHYWSSSYSPNSYYSYNLYFNSGLLNSSCSEYRHYGFSVRLVRSAM